MLKVISILLAAVMVASSHFIMAADSGSPSGATLKEIRKNASGAKRALGKKQAEQSRVQRDKLRLEARDLDTLWDDKIDVIYKDHRKKMRELKEKHRQELRDASGSAADKYAIREQHALEILQLKFEHYVDMHKANEGRDKAMHELEIRHWLEEDELEFTHMRGKKDLDLENERVEYEFHTRGKLSANHNFSTDGPSSTHVNGAMAGTTPEVTPGSAASRLDPKAQSCRGRVGPGCDGLIDGSIKEPFHEPVFQHPCDSDSSLVCVTSLSSVGAIKHDRCCDKARSMGIDGHWCPPTKDRVSANVWVGDIKSPCEAQWEDAVRDYREGNSFEYTWRYKIGDASEKDEQWWLGMAPKGTAVNQSNPHEDRAYCEAGLVCQTWDGKWVCGQPLNKYLDYCA